MKKRCRNCGVESNCTVTGGFCSRSCKMVHIRTYYRELRRAQWEVYRKYKI